MAMLLWLPGAARAGGGAADPALMRGFPPPEDKQVLRSNLLAPPFNRWSFQHIRELQPTREIWRGDGASSTLEAAPMALGNFKAPIRNGRVVTLDQLLEESHTDAFLVLHRGRLVFERYLNGQQRHTQHQMFSATKSFVGTLALMLIEEGRIDPAAPVSRYVPELAQSGFGDATVQHVLDMTTAIQYSEIYDDPESDIWRYGYVFGVWGAPPAGYSGPMTIYDYLPTLGKATDRAHGRAFHYVTPNTDVLGWIIRRVSGKSVDQNIAERLLQPLGAERDAYIWLDGAGTEMAGGGLNITARDAARFGQMILQGGRYNGRQVLPPAVAKRILQPGDPETFTRWYRQFPDTDWYGKVAFGYHDQWWTFNNAHRAVSAIGVHGQYIYLDPRAEMVVVKQSSSPDAEGGANDSNDTDGPMFYQALAEHLLSTP